MFILPLAFDKVHIVEMGFVTLCLISKNVRHKDLKKYRNWFKYECIIWKSYQNFVVEFQLPSIQHHTSEIGIISEKIL